MRQILFIMRLAITLLWTAGCGEVFLWVTRILPKNAFETIVVVFCYVVIFTWYVTFVSLVWWPEKTTRWLIK